MKNYLNQLLLDIQQAHHVAEAPMATIDEQSFEMQMEAVERWATGDGKPRTLSQETGLQPEHFPPPEKLSVSEKTLIMDALQSFFQSWNMEADIPNQVPLDMAYSLMISLLNEEAWYLPGGTIHHDFCTGYAPDCELKEYCPCLDHWKDYTQK